MECKVWWTDQLKPINLNKVVQGQKYQASTAAGPSKQSTKPTSTVRAYDVAEVYRQRKEYKMKKVKEEEERLRKHKAKPMPNFRAIHLKANSASKMSVEDVVSPETPQVLRRGLAMKEKQKQKVLNAFPIRFPDTISIFEIFR